MIRFSKNCANLKLQNATAGHSLGSHRKGEMIEKMYFPLVVILFCALVNSQRGM